MGLRVIVINKPVMKCSVWNENQVYVYLLIMHKVWGHFETWFKWLKFKIRKLFQNDI